MDNGDGMTIRELVEEVRTDMKEVRADVASIKQSIPRFVTWRGLGGLVATLATITIGIMALLQ